MITLSIIGVVAALTIPSLIVENQKKETIVKLQKAYNSLIGAQNLAIAENGAIEGWDFFTKGDFNSASNFFKKYLAPHMNIIQSCEPNQNGCGNNETYGMNGSLQVSYGHRARFVLADGTVVTFSTIPGVEKYSDVYVNLSPQKKKNIMGKDTFRFDFTESGFRFVDAGRTRQELSAKGGHGCSKQGSGQFCSTLIYHDGWQMLDDYPW